MATLDFENLRAELDGMSLHEVDFAVGDAFVSRLREVKIAIDDLDTTTEPWVAQWLSAEHTKAAMLWAAAKLNWSKEESAGADGTFNARARGRLIDRFNSWRADLLGRLDAYEQSGRTASDVAAWTEELERFRKDPVRNA